MAPLAPATAELAGGRRVCHFVTRCWHLLEANKISWRSGDRHQCLVRASSTWATSGLPSTLVLLPSRAPRLPRAASARVRCPRRMKMPGRALLSPR